MTAANRVVIALIVVCSAIIYGYYLQAIVGPLRNHAIPPVVNKDTVTSASWQRCAEPALVHNPVCQFHLGVQLAEGNGVAQDTTQALALITAAAEQDYTEAQLQLGISYASGMLGSKDLDKAIHWITRAARGGSAEAQFYLGSARESGNYNQLEQDYQQAYIWFTLSLNNGNSKALRLRDEVLPYLSPAQREAADAEVKSMQQAIDKRRRHEHDLFRF